MCIFLFSVVSFLNHLPVKLHILQRISLQPPLPGSLPSQNFLSAVRNTTFTSLSSRITPPPPPPTHGTYHMWRTTSVPIVPMTQDSMVSLFSLSSMSPKQTEMFTVSFTFFPECPDSLLDIVGTQMSFTLLNKTPAGLTCTDEYLCCE